MTQVQSENEPFRIKVGPLTGLGSLSLYTAPQLRRFNEVYQRGCVPDVEWDLSDVEPRRMSMASLAGFLSLADRMRKFTGKASAARVSWKPEVFAFWQDIAFLSLARDFDLLYWLPEHIIGGFSPGHTNPNTKILAFPFTDDVPTRDNPVLLHRWKDSAREEYKRELAMKCGMIFRPSNNSISFERSFSDGLAITTAELIVNCLLWGRSTAFVALQRSTAGITIAVCDCGPGLLRTLHREGRHSQSKDHLSAIVEACLMNQMEWGLRRAIDSVIERKGWVVVSTFDTEVRWADSGWQRLKDSAAVDEAEVQWLPDVTRSICEYRPARKIEHSYWRRIPAGLRGVRISFEIPF